MRGFIQRVFEGARGILGLGAIGGGLGLSVGFLGDLLLRIAETGIVVGADQWVNVLQMAVRSGTQWALVGVFVGSGFGSLVALTAGRRALDELATGRMAYLGGLVGALFLPVYISLREGWSGLLATEVLPMMGITAAIGAALSASAIAIAKRAHRAEIAAGSAEQGLLEAGTNLDAGMAEFGS